MIKLNIRSFIFLKALVISILVFCFVPNIVLAKQAVMKKIQIQHDPLSVKFFVSRDVPVKVIQVEKKELLIALKNVKLEKGFKITGKEKSGIKHVGVEKLQGNVLAVILTGQNSFGYIQSRFNKSDSTFIINLEQKRAKPLSRQQKASRQPEKTSVAKIIKKEIKKNVLPQKKQKSRKKPLQEISKPDSRIAALSVYIPPKRTKGENKGDISNLVRLIGEMGCDSKQISNSIIFLKKGLYKEAFDVLDQYIFQENLNCFEQAFF